MTADGGRGGDDDVSPRWLETIPVSAGAIVASIGLAGLSLALVGRFTTPAAILIGLPVATAGILAVRRRTPVRPSRGGAGAAVAAVLVSGLFLANAMWAPSEHVLINRDPGAYVTTARWLAREGTLETSAARGGLTSNGALEYGSFAVHDLGLGELQSTFGHLPSVVLAVAYDIGGHELMFRVPALLGAAGLLGVYAVAVRATRRPWLALVAPAMLGASMPLVHVSRDAYSEPFTLVLLWAAILVGIVATRARSASVAAVVGLLMGAAIGTRIDSLLYLAIAFPLLAAWVAAAPGGSDELRRRLRTVGVVLAVTTVAAMPGALDLQLRAGRYLSNHAEQLTMLRAAVAVSFVVSATAVVVALRRPRVVGVVSSFAARAAAPAGVLTTVLILAGWLLRPHLQVARSDREVALIGALQSRAGVAVDASRQYAEMTLQWMSWYVGPIALLLAAVGAGCAVHRTLRGRVDEATVVVTALLCVAGGLYWWRPSIVPDHIWAMRRYTPAVLPALAVIVTSTLALAWDAPRPQKLRPLRRGGVAAVGISVVLWSATVTWPVRQLREQHGYVDVLSETCELIGSDASVVIVGQPSSDVLPQSMRAWCGVPVASVRSTPDPDLVEQIRSEIGAAGRAAVWIATDPDLLPQAVEGGSRRSTAVARETRQAERTLLHPPRRYSDPGAGWSLWVQREPI